MPKKRRRPVKVSSATPKPKKISATKSAVVKPTMPSVAATQTAPRVGGEYSYVGREIRHILTITGVFVLLQLLLWYVFAQTGIESKLVDLIKL